MVGRSLGGAFGDARVWIGRAALTATLGFRFLFLFLLPGWSFDVLQKQKNNNSHSLAA